jgi:hypothetical protein
VSTDLGAESVLIPTPLTDAFASGRKAVFTNVVGWARSIERSALKVGEQLRLVDPATHLSIVEQALSEVEAFLQPNSGRFARILARPPSHLVPGSPARQKADAYLAELTTRANVARDVAAALLAFRKDLAKDGERFGNRLPNVTRALLQRAQLEEQHLRVIRSRNGIERARLRYAVVREELIRYEAASLEWTRYEERETLVEDAGQTIDELHALVTFARNERARLTTRRGVGTLLRELASTQFNILASIAETTNLTVGSNALERVLARADALQASLTPVRGEQEIITAGALGAATRAASQREGMSNSERSQFVWGPSPVPRRDPESDLGESVEWNALAISNDLVCLSRLDESVLRLFNAGRKLGSHVDLVVKPGRRIRDDDFERVDLTALNEVAHERAGWFTQTTRARIELIATDGDLWFGRLVRKGTLKRSSANAASQIAPKGLSVKLLGPRREWNNTAPHQDIIPEGQPVVFGGISRIGARSALEDGGLVVAHAVDDVANGAANAALLRERALFEALELQGGTTESPFSCRATTFIGVGKTPMSAPCILYRAFADLEMRDDAATEWLRCSQAATFATIRSVAEIFNRTWKANWTLGVCTANMFGFSLRWDPESGMPLPAARLIAAPFATPLGESYLKQCAEEVYDLTKHERIGITIFPKRVRQEGNSAVGTDMLALLSFCYELLARSTIDYGEGVLASWGGIGRVAIETDQFRSRRFVAISAFAAKTPEGREAIFKMFGAVAAGSLSSLTACERFLSESGETDASEPLVLGTRPRVGGGS